MGTLGHEQLAAGVAAERLGDEREMAPHGPFRRLRIVGGDRLDDLGVLGMAKTFESLRGPQKPWPKPPK